MTLRPQTSASGNWQIEQLGDGTDLGRGEHAVVDLFHKGADYLHYFRCRTRVACLDQLVYLIAAALPGNPAQRPSKWR